MTEVLRNDGYIVEVVSNGREAFVYCERNTPDIVLMDAVMPEMDGSEVQGRMRDLYPQLKVLLTSGYHEVEISRRFAGRGLAGFLQKPYRLEELAAKLNQVIGHVPVEAPLPAD